METLAQLFTHLAQKAGIPADDANLINVLSNAELSKIRVHSDLITGIDNALLSIAQATDNHPTVKAKYHAQALNAVDARILAGMQAAGLSEDVIAELSAEKSTYNRLDKVLAAIKDAATAAERAANKGKASEDKSALQKQVDELLATITGLKTSHEAKVAEMLAAQKAARITSEVRNLLAGTKTIFDDMAPGVKTAALDSLIQKALTERKASFDFDENDAFVLKGEGDAAVVSANNTRYTPQSFIDETLAANKVVKVADPKTTTTNDKQQAQGGTPPNGTPNYQRQVQANGNVGNNASTIADRNRAAREAFERSVAS